MSNNNIIGQPPTKRFKAHPGTPVFPEALFRSLVSFCSFETLVTLRSVCRNLKKHAGNELGNRATSCLPLEYEESEDEWSVGAKLSAGWSDEYSSRDGVWKKAAGAIAHMGGDQVSLGIDHFDGDRVRQPLGRRGWVDVEDFLREEDQLPVDISDDGHFTYRSSLRGKRDRHSYSEVGWGIDTAFRNSLSHKQAWSKFHKMLEELKQDDDDASLLREACQLRELLFSLLINASTIQYAYYKEDFRHTDYPSSNTQHALLFVSLGNRFQLVCSSACESY